MNAVMNAWMTSSRVMFVSSSSTGAESHELSPNMAIVVTARGAAGGGHGMADGGGAGGGDGGDGAAGGGGAGPWQHACTSGVARHAAHAVSVKPMPDAVAINASARSSSALLSEQSDVVQAIPAPFHTPEQLSDVHLTPASLSWKAACSDESSAKSNPSR